MYITYFDQITKDDLGLVGGKGFALGNLLQAGFPVPHGFVITIKAYKKYYTHEIPHEFTEEIIKAFRKLKTERVAVRSSAIAEDSRTASWAGQLESYLNVSEINLIANIKKCWESINSKRAKSYAKGQNIPKEKLIVAVVVQKMVNSETAGVAFTQNPVTNNPKEMVIESCYGLGELLVQGTITPDNFIVGKESNEIITSHPNSQKSMLVYKEGKQTQISVPQKLRGKPSIAKAQVKDIAKLAKKIEDYFGSPQDIEWAIENGKLFLVQSRPITTIS